MLAGLDLFIQNFFHDGNVAGGPALQLLLEGLLLLPFHQVSHAVKVLVARRTLNEEVKLRYAILAN